MQLSEVEILSADYTPNDVSELVAVIQSTRLSSPSAVLRWGKIPPPDLQDWLLNQCTVNLRQEFQVKRISRIKSQDGKLSSPRAERLVVRDSDMDRLGTKQDNLPHGRIVAYADYRYMPSYGTPDSATNTTGITSPTPAPIPSPPGFDQALHAHITERVASSMLKCFRGLPCFELSTISTLSRSHLRKGIAKRLTEWIFPYADGLGLPVVLSASPVGFLLYRKCGFVEYRQFDVVVSLQALGDEARHELVTMIRWPHHMKDLPEAWQRWRATHDMEVKKMSDDRR